MGGLVGVAGLCSGWLPAPALCGGCQTLVGGARLQGGWLHIPEWSWGLGWPMVAEPNSEVGGCGAWGPKSIIRLLVGILVPDTGCCRFWVVPKLIGEWG